MSTVTPFGGLWVASVTPFCPASVGTTPQVDFPAFDAHLKRLVAGGVTGIVVLGSTGEAQTITEAERIEVMRAARRAVPATTGLMVGVGYSATTRAVEACQQAQELGFDAVLATAPAYNKPQQAGLIAHFRAMHDACRLPLMLYNVPGRAAVNILPETVMTLLDLPRMRGIKEASGDLRQVTELMRLLQKEGVGSDRFAVLSGDDDLVFPCLALGATGLVSVAGNVASEPLVRLIADHAAGRIDVARESYLRWLPFMRALFIEANPVPVKALLAQMGAMGAVVRLPLVPLAPDNASRLFHAAREVGVLPNA